MIRRAHVERSNSDLGDVKVPQNRLLVHEDTVEGRNQEICGNIRPKHRTTPGAVLNSLGIRRPMELTIIHEGFGDAIDIQTLQVDLVLMRLSNIPDPARFPTATPLFLTAEHQIQGDGDIWAVISYLLTAGSGLQVCTCLNEPGNTVVSIIDISDAMVICCIIRKALQRGRGRSVSSFG